MRRGPRSPRLRPVLRAAFVSAYLHKYGEASSGELSALLGDKPESVGNTIRRFSRVVNVYSVPSARGLNRDAWRLLRG